MCKDGGECESENTFQALRTVHRPVRANYCGVKAGHASYVYQWVVLHATKIKLKLKVKVTVLQALRLCTGRTAHRGIEV
jgi:hypothetical protein